MKTTELAKVRVTRKKTTWSPSVAVGASKAAGAWKSDRHDK